MGCGGRRSGERNLCADERRFCGRRSRVVLTPRRWRQACGETRRRWWQESPVTKESAKEPVKTIAQGRPGFSGEPVVTTLVCFFISHARLRVQRAPGFPCALCFVRAEILAQLGRKTCRGNAESRVSCPGRGAAPLGDAPQSRDLRCFRHEWVPVLRSSVTRCIAPGTRGGTTTSLRGAKATKQSILSSCSAMDCFADARNDGYEKEE
jgi:hypothetical protein